MYCGSEYWIYKLNNEENTIEVKNKVLQEYTEIKLNPDTGVYYIPNAVEEIINLVTTSKTAESPTKKKKKKAKHKSSAKKSSISLNNLVGDGCDDVDEVPQHEDTCKIVFNAIQHVHHVMQKVTLSMLNMQICSTCSNQNQSRNVGMLIGPRTVKMMYIIR